MSRFNLTLLASLVLLVLGSTTTALQQLPVVDRRNAFGLLGASAATLMAAVTVTPDAAQATAAKTGTASPFTGFYDDPNHPGCLRSVKVVGAPLKGDGTRSPFPVIEVTGYDGPEGAKMCTDRPTRDQLWKITGTVKNSNEAVLDFSPKGGPAKLLGKFQDGAIVFPDGNKWTKVTTGTPDRLPKDMSTLKSVS